MYKPFSPVRNLEKGFVGEGSSPRYTGRTFKGFVDFFIRFLRLWASLDAFRNLRNLFGGFGKAPLFLQCTKKLQFTHIFEVLFVDLVRVGNDPYLIKRKHRKFYIFIYVSDFDHSHNMEDVTGFILSIGITNNLP